MKEALEERDENGKMWFTDKNISAVLVNITGAGTLQSFKKIERLVF